MKTFSAIFFICAAFIFSSCNKKNNPEPAQNKPIESEQEYCGPYGKISAWKSIGGDTLFTQKLTLTYFYTEQANPCAVYYYSQNYSLWNDYDYTLSVNSCLVVNDTLIMIDIDTNKKAIFKREG